MPMYLKEDLDGKSFDELLGLAREMGIKKPESMSKIDLVFRIIDEQAVQSDETPKLRKRRRASAPLETDSAAPASAAGHPRPWRLTAPLLQRTYSPRQPLRRLSRSVSADAPGKMRPPLSPPPPHRRLRVRRRTRSRK